MGEEFGVSRMIAGFVVVGDRREKKKRKKKKIIAGCLSIIVYR